MRGRDDLLLSFSMFYEKRIFPLFSDIKSERSCLARTRNKYIKEVK